MGEQAGPDGTPPKALNFVIVYSFAELRIGHLHLHGDDRIHNSHEVGIRCPVDDWRAFTLLDKIIFILILALVHTLALERPVHARIR